MSKEFNPYSVAITSIQKSIKYRESKIIEQKMLEKLSLDFEHRCQLATNIGCTESEVELTTGLKKKSAKKS